MPLPGILLYKRPPYLGYTINQRGWWCHILLREKPDNSATTEWITMLYLTLPNNESKGLCRINGEINYYYNQAYRGRLLVAPMIGDTIPAKTAFVVRKIMQTVPSQSQMPNPAFPGATVSPCTSYICQ